MQIMHGIFLLVALHKALPLLLVAEEGITVHLANDAGDIRIRLILPKCPTTLFVFYGGVIFGAAHPHRVFREVITVQNALMESTVE